MFQKPIEDFVRDYSAALGVSREEFVENLVVDLMARVHIREEIGMTYGLFIHLAQSGDSLMKGKELFDFLAQYYRGEMDVVEDARASLSPEEVEREGKGQANRIKLKHYQDEGLIASDFYGPAALAVRYVEQYKAGKIMRERLDQILSSYKRK